MAKSIADLSIGIIFSGLFRMQSTMKRDLLLCPDRWNKDKNSSLSLLFRRIMWRYICLSALGLRPLFFLSRPAPLLTCSMFIHFSLKGSTWENRPPKTTGLGKKCFRRCFWKKCWRKHFLLLSDDNKIRHSWRTLAVSAGGYSLIGSIKSKTTPDFHLHWTKVGDELRLYTIG